MKDTQNVGRGEQPVIANSSIPATPQHDTHVLKEQINAALAESEANFRLLADNVGEVFWFMEMEPPRVTYVNPAFENIWGFGVSQLYADHECWQHSIHPDDRPLVQAMFKAWTVGEIEKYHIEYRLLPPDGSTRWILDRGIVIGRRDGRPNVYSGIARDITERKLSEQHFKGLLESAPDAMIIVNQRGKIELVNAQTLKVFGYSREELMGKPLEILVPERYRGIHMHHRADYETAPHTRPMGVGRELYAMRKDGSEFPTEISLSPLETAQGRVIISTVRDITENKRVAQALHVSELRFRSFFETAAVGAVQMDVNGVFVQVNDRYCSILGYKREELVGKMGPFDLDHPDDIERDRESFEETLSGARRSHEIEKRMIRKDGTIIWVHMASTGVWNANGNLDSTSAVVEDITARKTAEEQIRSSEERFRSFFENAAVGTAQLDASGKFISVNDRLCALCGYTREELLNGMSPLDLDYSGDKAGNVSHLRSFLRGEIVQYQTEKRYVRKDGGIVWAHVSASVIKARDGSFRYAAGVVEDITSRKLVEDALHASEQKLRLFVEHSPAPVAMFDREMRYLLVSKRWSDSFNPGSEPLIGRSHYEIFPDIPEHWRQIHQRCLAGQSQSSERDQFPGPDGTLNWIKWEIRPWHDSRGEIGGVMLFAEIINDRVRIENEIKYARHFAESTLEAVPASLAVLNAAGVIVGTNQAWQEFAQMNGGIQTEISKGVNYLDICHASAQAGHEGAARFRDGIREVMEGRCRRFSMEYACHSPKEKRWFVGYVTPFNGNGPHSVVVAHVDISERKRAEETIRQLNEKLEDRVARRTADLRIANEDLRSEITKRRRLEQEVSSISDLERQRIGQDLHDDLGQQIAGISLLSGVLKKNLADQGSAEVLLAEEIISLLKDALSLTRSLARGLQPVAMAAGGLSTALKELSERTANMFRIQCRTICPADIILDNTTATHLYRIAQEAVTNAVKHGSATKIKIEMSTGLHHSQLSIQDDGSGIPLQPTDTLQGMGLRIMRYRADLIGGTLEFGRPDTGGSIVACTFHAKGKTLTHPSHG